MYKVFALIFALLPLALLASIFSDKSGYLYKSGSVLISIFWALSYIAFLILFLAKGMLEIKKDTLISHIVSRLGSVSKRLRISSKLLTGLIKIFVVSFVVFISFMSAFMSFRLFYIENNADKITMLSDYLKNGRRLSTDIGEINRNVNFLVRKVQSLEDRMINDKAQEFFDRNDKEITFKTSSSSAYSLNYMDLVPNEENLDSNIKYTITRCGPGNTRMGCFTFYVVTAGALPYFIFDADDSIEDFYVDEYFLGDSINPISVYFVETEEKEMVAISYVPNDNESGKESMVTNIESDYIEVNIVNETDSSITIEVISYRYDDTKTLQKSLDQMFSFSYNSDLSSTLMTMNIPYSR